MAFALCLESHALHNHNHNHNHGLGLDGGSIGIAIPENGLCEIRGCSVNVVAVPSDAGSVSRRQCHTACALAVFREMRTEVRIILTARCDHHSNLASIDANVLGLHDGRVNTHHDRLRAVLGGLEVCNATRLREGEGDITTPILIWLCRRILKISPYFFSSSGGPNPDSHRSRWTGITTE